MWGWYDAAGVWPSSLHIAAACFDVFYFTLPSALPCRVWACPPPFPPRLVLTIHTFLCSALQLAVPTLRYDRGLKQFNNTFGTKWVGGGWLLHERR